MSPTSSTARSRTKRKLKIRFFRIRLAIHRAFPARLLFLLMLLHGGEFAWAMDAIDGSSSAEKAEACFTKLQVDGIKFERATQPETKNDACLVEAPVKLIAAREGKTEITFPDKPLLACAFVGKFAQFVFDVADPLALSAMASTIKTIETGPGHECRFRNRALSGKMSEHGHGLAVDLRALTLTDGRRLVVGAENEKRFLETLSKAACGFFSTVLGPDGDAMHKDHLHLDAEVRQSLTGKHFCQP